MATSMTLPKNGFFNRLKASFSPPSKHLDVSLNEGYRLCNESIRIPIEDHTIGLTLNSGNASKTLHIFPEEFQGDAGHQEHPALIICDPDNFFSNINGFIRLTKGDHLILGREDEYQQAIFDYPANLQRRHLSIVHDGTTLLLKDLEKKSGIPLEIVSEKSGRKRRKKRRMATLQEIRTLFGGPVQMLSPDEALKDLLKINEILEKEPLRPRDSRGMPGGVVSLPKKMIPIILGDLHAQVENLLTLLSQNEFIEQMGDGRAAMIFLGDAVHSEVDGHLEEMDNSLLMMDLIFRLKLWFPQQVFYVRGNHDDFSEELGKSGVPQGLLWAKALRESRGQAYLDAMKRFYQLLPYVALSKGYVACHAAPPKTKVSMDMLINIHQYPGLIQELTCNRLYRPNRPAGYTKGDVKRFRNVLKLGEDAELFVGHTPLTRHDTLWVNVGGIAHHDVVFSANLPWIGVFTRVDGKMIPLRYRAESLLPVINGLQDLPE
ncbi:MAG: metallophosphoesterase [Gammaproteobacteria bacterium]|nr:metallophosphoesterase [Gammaproteobacteria bacterium]